MKLTFTVGGDLYEVEGDNFDQLKDQLDLASSKELSEALVNVKQVLVAKAVFTGAAQKEASKASAGSDAPPWKNDSDVPSCKHGPMTDLRGKKNKSGEAYKFDFYCNAPKDVPWKEKCDAKNA
jgi:hypothetical protein